MSRAERLLNLIDELRVRKRPAAGVVLAEKMGVSIRTLYRDIASLRTQGAPIDGEIDRDHGDAMAQTKYLQRMTAEH